MKILVVGNNVVNLVKMFSQSFKDMGHEVHSCLVGKEHTFYNDCQHDFHLDYDTLVEKSFVDDEGRIVCTPRKEFYDLVESYDMFQFISCTTLLPGMCDLPILRQMQKKIGMRSTGSDLRFVYPGSIYTNYYNIHFSMDLRCGVELYHNTKQDLSFYHRMVYSYSLAKKLYMTNMISEYADVIYGSPAHVSLMTVPFFAAINFCDKKGIQTKIPLRKKPIIAMFPSNETIKGTKIILNALEKIKSEGIDFELVYNKEKIPNKQVRMLLTQTDILIDDIACGGHGYLANEAMLSGCVVLGANSGQPLPRNRPVIPIDKNNVYEQIKRAILDIPFRKKVSDATQAYVEKGVNSIENASQYLLDCFARAKQKDYDYFPTLFIDNPFIPNYAEFIDKYRIKMFFGDADFQLPNRTEFISPFIRTMLAKNITKCGVHPHSDLKKFCTQSILQYDQNSLQFTPRWKIDSLEQYNPWLWTGPNATYGLPDEDAISYSELTL